MWRGFVIKKDCYERKLWTSENKFNNSCQKFEKLKILDFKSKYLLDFLKFCYEGAFFLKFSHHPNW